MTSPSDLYAQQYQAALRATNEAPAPRPSYSPPQIDTATVALRQQVIAQNPNLDDAGVSRAVSRIRGEQTRAEAAALGAAIEADWQAERSVASAEADALYGRIVANAAAPETAEQHAERRRQSINRENSL